MATKSFDLIDALIADGFERTEYARRNGYKQTKLAKHYEKQTTLAWYGKTVSRFDVEVWFTYYHGEVCRVHVEYSNGKVKDHAYNKRAYNAIRDTVQYNGYEF